MVTSKRPFTFGVNNISQPRNCSKVLYELMVNLKKTATKCISFKVSKVLVLGIAFSMTITKFADEVNYKVNSICNGNSFLFVNNRNISVIYIYLTVALIC